MMEFNGNFNKIGIIGLGLIGGTLAKTIRRIYPRMELVACDPCRESLDAALAEGVITQACTALSPELSGCRYLFLCAPVQENGRFLQELAPLLSRDCILTDTGSVKSAIHEEIRALGLSGCFIGGHPMAGSEKSGYANSTAYLFENAYYIITHDKEIARELVEEYQGFIASLGCIPFLMEPKEHDYVTAAVSHLPHILASSLVNLVQKLDNEAEYMKSIAAGGFKDITRIASSSPVMWQEICQANRSQIIRLLDVFMESLARMKTDIADADSHRLLSFFQEAKDYRDSLPIKKTGPLPSIFELYCDLIDEAGGIATIATILATNGISIKNIGIIHNREFEEGVLRIEFYAEEALKKAVTQLRKHRYVIYER